MAGVLCDDAAFDIAKQTVGDAGFSSAKTAMIKTLCQNFVFTTEQVAGLLEEFGHSSDKLEALGLFEGQVLNPSEADPVVGVFNFSSGKESAAEKLSEFTAAEAGELAVFRIEDDGHRSDADLDRFIEAIEEASMSDDKVAVAEAECADHPSPPFDAEQLVRVLKCYAFSSDVAQVLALFAGPAIVYPMTCEEIISILEVFSMSDDKLAVLPSLKPFIRDPQNKLSIVASFNFSSDKEKAEEILRDVVVNLRPKTPPMAAIQEALRRVGTCPSGYDWRQVQSGWRCAAGGHYVSDATLEAAM